MMRLLRLLVVVAAGITVATTGYTQGLQAIVGGSGAAPAATTSQLLLGGSVGVLAGTADRVIPLAYSATAVTGDFKSIVFPVPGVLSGFRVYTTVTPAAGKTWDITVNKNGSASAVTCQITSAAATCTSASTVSVAAGDYATIFSHPTSAPTNSQHMTSVIFTPTTANDSIIMSQGASFSTSVINAVVPFNNLLAPSTVANRRTFPLPDSGTIDTIYVGSNAPGAGTSYDYTLYKNGSATSLTCQIAGTATGCGPGTGSSTPAAGDDVEFTGTPTGTPATATAGFGARFRPTTAGGFVVSNTSSLPDNASSTTFYALTGQALSTTESAAQSYSDSMTITAMQVKRSAAPGAGKTVTYTLLDRAAGSGPGAGSSTGLTCTINNPATTCSATGTIVVGAGDWLDTSAVTSGSPTAAQASISYLATR